MSEYEKLVRAERSGAHTIEIIEPATGKEGVAGVHPTGVSVFYGADDGSDDAIISVDEFNKRFRITAILSD